MKRKNRKQKQVRRKKIKSKATKVQSNPVAKDFPNEDMHLLFSMVGANYLSSDFEQGTWQPLFDLSSMIPIDEQQAKIAMKAYSEQDNEIDQSYLIPCSWVILPSTLKRNIYDQLVLDCDYDLYSSDVNFSVWEFFHNFKGMIAEFVSAHNLMDT